ncbi:MAG: glycosyltransferase family 4 protein [Flavobacteriales bacterium]|nr:glycosyltransferase family 4 protein [Flavobacteriales bacterium]
MRILYLRTRFVFGLKAGGSVTHTSGVINAIADKNEIKVLSNDVLPGLRVPYEILKPKPLKWLPMAIREFLYNMRVVRHCSSNFNESAIYQRLSGYSIAGAKLSRRFKVPFIIEYNSSSAWSLKNWSKLQSWKSLSGFAMNTFKYLIEIPLAEWVERYNLKNASVVVVVSEELRSQLEQKGVQRERIVFYPNGVDPEVYNPERNGTAVREKLGLNDSLVMGFIGSFGQWHGTDILAEAIVEFYELYPQFIHKVRFVLIGDGLMMETVKQILKGLRNREDVILTGMIPQNEAVDYLAACNILLSPHKPNPDGTRFFGSPTKLFEYMALGKGIVASDLEQIGDILQDGINARLVEPGDPTALAKAIYEAALDPEAMKNMGLHARRDVLEKYSWERHVDQILKGLKKDHLTSSTRE